MRVRGNRKPSVVVMGLGTFGSQTARALYRGGANVLAIDRVESKIDDISSSVTKAICVDVTNTDALGSNGAFEVDVAIVALRRHFDASVLATHALKKRGLEEILVQVATEQEAEAILTVGATSAVFPERDMADRIARNILVPGIAEHIPLGADVAIIETPLPHSFVGKTLIDLHLRSKFGVTVIAVTSHVGGEERVEVAPPADQPLKAGDNLVVIGKTNELNEFRKRVQS